MAHLIPDDLDTLLTRVGCAAALTEAGFPISPETLATKATRGGGPPFRKFGPRALYPWGLALAWAQSRLGPVVSSTSELDAGQTGSAHGTDWRRPPTPTNRYNEGSTDPDSGECVAASRRLISRVP